MTRNETEIMNRVSGIKMTSDQNRGRLHRDIGSLDVLRLFKRFALVALFTAFFYVIAFSFDFSLNVRYAISVTTCILLIVFTRGSFLSNLRFSIYSAIWLLLLLSMQIAATITNGLDNELLDFTLIYILYIVITSRGLMELDENGYAILSSALVLSADLVLFRSLAEVPLSATMYSGLMANPNSLGIFLVAPIDGALFLFCMSKSKIGKASSVCQLAFLFYIVYCTSCRSALVASLISISIIFIHKLKLSKNYKSYAKYLTTYMLISCILLVLIIFESQLVMFAKGLIFKWWAPGTQGDLSSGRIEMWRFVINNVPFFGWGKVLIHCHNDFVLWVEKYGWISASLLAMMLAALLVQAVRQYMQRNNILMLFNIIYVIDYIIIASFEEIIGMFGKPLVIMMFIALGNIIYIYNEQFESYTGDL